MKNTKLSLITGLCAGLLLSGCGDWNQNPLDGKKGDFGQGKPVPTKPDLGTAIKSDAVRINVPDFQTFQEGVVAEFPVSARILKEGYVAEVRIENISDFPGATFNPATGVFRWMPPVGFIDASGETGPELTKVLSVRAIGTKPDAQVLYEEVQTPMYIKRQFKAPEIVNITKPESFIREGTTMIVPVTITDRDAAPADRNTWPKLIFQSVTGSKSLAGLTVVARDESLGNGQYRMHLQIDARDMELTDSVDTFKINLIATSAYNVSSTAQPLVLDVFTSLATPVATWDNVVQVSEGQALTHKFLINDPKMEAWLSLERTFSLPSGSNLSCQPTGRGLLNCAFTWAPLAGQAGDYEFQIYVKSRNNDARDTMQPVKTLTFRTQVLPKGS